MMQEREEVVYIQDLVLATTLKYFWCEYIWVELKNVVKNIYEFKFVKTPELTETIDKYLNWTLLVVPTVFIWAYKTFKNALYLQNKR